MRTAAWFVVGWRTGQRCRSRRIAALETSHRYPGHDLDRPCEGRGSNPPRWQLRVRRHRVTQDGVRVRSPFAEFRLDAPGPRRDRPPERCRTFDDARSLIHSIYVDEHTDLCPVLSQHEPLYAEGPDMEEL